MMKKLRFVSLFVILAVFSATPAWAKLKVVTTLPSFADIAKEVGGGDASVVSLTRGNQDPHFVDAKPDLILQLNKADLLVRAGLGLEDGWLPPLQTGARNGSIQTGGNGNLDASTLVSLREVPHAPLDRSMGDVHPGGNPHFMLDPNNGIVLAKGLAERMGKLDPEHAAAYQKRADDYSEALKKKIAAWKKSLAPLKGWSVVTYHKSWIYFLEWAGLKDAGQLEPKPGIPPSPEHVVSTIRMMKEKKVKLMFMETYYPKGTAEEVARATGAKLLILPTEVGATPAIKSYFDIFDSITKSLAVSPQI